jgi:hypothetical protein
MRVSILVQEAQVGESFHISKLLTFCVVLGAFEPSVCDSVLLALGEKKEG